MKFCTWSVPCWIISLKIRNSNTWHFHSTSSVKATVQVASRKVYTNINSPDLQLKKRRQRTKFPPIPVQPGSARALPICSALLASKQPFSWEHGEHMWQLPGSLQLYKQSWKIQFHQLLQFATINTDQIEKKIKSHIISTMHTNPASFKRWSGGLGPLEDTCSLTSKVTVLTIEFRGISDMHVCSVFFAGLQKATLQLKAAMGLTAGGDVNLQL